MRRLAAFGVGLALMVVVGSFPGQAEFLHTQEFDAASFKAAQQGEKGTVLAIGTDWCPVCTRQGALLARLSEEPAYRDMMLFHIDYEEQKSVAREFKASAQGTLIGFHGGKEVGRLVGITDEATIRAFLDRIKNGGR